MAESLARMGARVHAIDITQENIRVAEKHAQKDPSVAGRVRYECVSAEALVERGERYDLVLASEVIEHVKRPDLFVSVLSSLMKSEAKETPALSPLLVLSTINRTIGSYAIAILGAEVLTGIVPKGTHEWEKFITPQEMTLIANAAGLKMELLAGIGLLLNKGGGGLLELTDNVDVNYIASFNQR